MGSGGGQTTTQQYPPWAVPAAGGLLNESMGLMNAALQGGFPFPPSQVAGFTPAGMAGQNMNTLAALGMGSVIDPMLANVQATQSGQFLDPASNPWLAATYNAAVQPEITQYRTATEPGLQAEFARAGSFGGSAQQQSEGIAQQNLGNMLANTATGIFGGNYAQERQNQLNQQSGMGNILQAAFAPGQQLMGIGNQQQQLGQNVLDTTQQNLQSRFQFPFNLLNWGSGQLGNIVGGQNQTRVSSGGKGIF